MHSASKIQADLEDVPCNMNAVTGKISVEELTEDLSCYPKQACYGGHNMDKIHNIVYSACECCGIMV